jgi:hypothetical protein
MLLPSEREQLDRIAPVIKAGAQFPASESLGSGKANPQTKEKS